MSTILVIDDHPAFRMVIKMQLVQLLGVEEVIEADNGQSAVEMAAYTRQSSPYWISTFRASADSMRFPDSSSFIRRFA